MHWKEIKDQRDGESRKVFGGYAQLGSFLSEWWPLVPAPLKVVGRVSPVNPDTPGASTAQWEYTVGANWFINGHRYKLTADLSLLDYKDSGSSRTGNRIRLQWALSL